MTPNANFKTYHEEFNSTDGVRIPYMGTSLPRHSSPSSPSLSLLGFLAVAPPFSRFTASVMSDLLFIDDFNDTRVSSGVNFTKARQLGSLVADALGSMVRRCRDEAAIACTGCDCLHQDSD